MKDQIDTIFETNKITGAIINNFTEIVSPERPWILLNKGSIITINKTLITNE